MSEFSFKFNYEQAEIRELCETARCFFSTWRDIKEANQVTNLFQMVSDGIENFMQQNPQIMDFVKSLTQPQPQPERKPEAIAEPQSAEAAKPANLKAKLAKEFSERVRHDIENMPDEALRGLIGKDGRFMVGMHLYRARPNKNGNKRKKK